MPLHGFIAMLNLYYFDVYKQAGAPDTSRYVGRWFYMQPSRDRVPGMEVFM